MSADAAPAYPENFWQRRRTGWLGLRYVLSSSDASRTEGVVSLLAALETLFAVALYWAIAARWDTHIHLVVSLFAAPLLLLRSPESIALGVEGFTRDNFDFHLWHGFSRLRKALWSVLFALLGACAAYALAHVLAQHWLAGESGGALIWRSGVVGLLASFIAIAVAGAVGVAVAGPGPDARMFAGAVAGMMAGTVAVMMAGTVAVMMAGAVTVAGPGPHARMFAGAAAEVVASVTVGVLTVVVMQTGPGWLVVAAHGVMVFELGAGLALRALSFRITSTLRRLPQGLARLPENWRESMLVIDQRSDAELLPGIKIKHPEFSFFWLLGRVKERESIFLLYVGLPQLVLLYFLPALIYRLYIKATAWCYWLLAYLLWRRPRGDQDRAWLTSPWGNELRRYALMALTLGGLVQLLVVLGLGPEGLKLAGDPRAAAISGLWPQALSPRAPWLGLAGLNALACAWLLWSASEFAHRYKEAAGYAPSSAAAGGFRFASRLHTLSVGLFLLCGIAAFTLHHFPALLDFMPPHQVEAVRAFLGLA